MNELIGAPVVEMSCTAFPFLFAVLYFPVTWPEDSSLQNRRVVFQDAIFWSFSIMDPYEHIKNPMCNKYILIGQDMRWNILCVFLSYSISMGSFDRMASTLIKTLSVINSTNINSVTALLLPTPVY